MATVKDKYICQRAILLNNRSREIDEKQFSVFGSRAGQISPLIMHVALSREYDRQNGSFIAIYLVCLPLATMCLSVILVIPGHIAHV